MVSGYSDLKTQWHNPSNGKTGILGNCVFATFSKNIKQLTYAGCQSEIPLNSSRFRLNRKFCYQSATKFSTMFGIGVEVDFT